MKCESCKKHEFVEDGVYYCPYLETEIDDDAAIITCRGYEPIKDKDKEI